MKGIRLAGFIFLLLIILAGCGKDISKEGLTAEEYFEYAMMKFEDEDYFDASTEFQIIVLRYSGDPIVDDAQFYLAESHFHMKEYLIAVAEYEKLINDYPQSDFVPQARYKIGLAYYRLSPRPELDQEYSRHAYRQFQAFIEEFPGHELRDDAEKYLKTIREKLAKKKLIAATTYRKKGVCDAAVIYYDIILEEYYDTKAAPEAFFWKGECLLSLKKLSEALTAFTAYVERYPQHKYAGKAKERIGEISKAINVTSSTNEKISKNDN